MFESIPSGLMDEELEEVYQNLYCPRFVWICELYSYSSYYQSSPKAIGEIVADATARQTGNTDSLDGIVLIHYPYYITYRGIDSNWQAFESNSKNIKSGVPLSNSVVTSQKSFNFSFGSLLRLERADYLFQDR